MSDRINVQITATDGASRVFQQVSSGADKMGTSLDNAEKSAGRFNNTAKLAGQAIGTALTAGLLLSVKAAADAEVSQQRLQTTIEATGALFEQYGAQIDAANNKALSLSFDDEAAQDALSALIQATGDVQFSMGQMGLAMDIARGRGIDLAAATKLVIAADQERFGALQRVGIAIDENSTKESVLADLQAKYAGQAQAYADTNAGAFDRWQNSIENALESVGAFLGPAQQLLVVFPGIAAGATVAGSALTSMGGASVALAGLAAVLTGPVGIVAAAALAGLAVKEFAGTIGPSFHQASDDAVKSVDALIAKIVELGDTSALAQTVLGLDTISASYQQINKDANDAIGSIGDWIAQAQVMDDANEKTVEGLMLSSAEFDNLTQHQRDVIDANKDGTATLTELTNAQATFNDEAENSQRILDGLEKGSDELAQIFTMTGEGAAEAKAAANDYTKALLDGELSAKDYELGLRSLIDGYGEIREDALASGEAIDTHTTTVSHAADAYGDLSVEAARAQAAMSQQELTAFFIQQADIDKARNLADLLKIVGSNYNTMSVEAARANAAAEQFQRATNNQLEIAADNYNAISVEAARAQTAAIAAQKQLAIAADSFQMPSVESAMAGAQMSPIDIKVFLDDQEAQQKAKDIAAATEDMTRAFNATTAAVTGTTEALDSGFRTVVSNTNAIADSAQGVQDWADKLIGASGTVATMDDLLARGVITQQDYNQAQAAYTPIAEANARIQDDILAIQTRQAPVIADLADQQADYMDTLAGMPAEQQRFALAMMDSATSAEALQLATSLLSENGDVFAPMVEAAANLDPYLATILDQMGLIEQQPDGTWAVTLDDQASSPMADLAASINDLTDQVYILTTYLDDDQANDGISKLDAQLADLSAFVATPTVNLVDNASGGLQSVAGLLASLDGRTATSYVTTVVQQVNQTLNPFALGGVAGYATGGVVARMAEWGPELLHFPNGGLAVAQTPGIYGVPSGTYVDTAPVTAGKLGSLNQPGFTFNNYGTIIGVDDLKTQITDAISQAWVRGMRQHEMSLGAP